MVLCVLQNQAAMELTHNPTNRKRKRKHSAPARRPEFFTYNEDSGSSTTSNTNTTDIDNETKIIKLNAEDIEVPRLPSFPHHSEASPTPHPGKSIELLYRI